MAGVVEPAPDATQSNTQRGDTAAAARVLNELESADPLSVDDDRDDVRAKPSSPAADRQRLTESLKYGQTSVSQIALAGCWEARKWSESESRFVLRAACYAHRHRRPRRVCRQHAHARRAHGAATRSDGAPAASRPSLTAAAAPRAGPQACRAASRARRQLATGLAS